MIRAVLRLAVLREGAGGDAGDARVGWEARHHDRVRPDDRVVTDGHVADDARADADVDAVADGRTFGGLGPSRDAHRRVVTNVDVIADRSRRKDHPAVMPDTHPSSEL